MSKSFTFAFTFADVIISHRCDDSTSQGKNLLTLIGDRAWKNLSLNRKHESMKNYEGNSKLGFPSNSKICGTELSYLTGIDTL